MHLYGAGDWCVECGVIQAVEPTTIQLTQGCKWWGGRVGRVMALQLSSIGSLA